MATGDGDAAEFDADAPAVGDAAKFGADAVLDRAWKAMVFGILLCPFQFYALYLLASIHHQELSPKAKRKYWTAYAIALGYLAVAVIVFFSCFSPLFESDGDPHPDWKPLKPAEQQIEFDL